MTTPLKSEPSPDSDTTKSLQTAERALDDADDVSHLIQGGLDVAEAVLKVASAVPLLGPVCNVAKDILDDVRKCADKAHDVLEAGRRVCDILKTIQVMARHLERLGEQERTDLKELMDEVRAALFDMRDLVKSFGQRGWFKRLLQLSQHENTFRKLDRKIRDKMEMAMRLYRFAQDTATAETQKELEIFLVDRIYALEEALAAKVEECTDQGYTSQQALGVIEQDAGTLSELAHDAGISAAEMSVEILEFQAEVRKDFEQLQSDINGLASSLTTGFDELKQLITGTASATRPLQPSRHSSGNSGERHALRNLTADHVVRMMHGLELGKYAPALHKLPMTGAALAVADDNDLREAGVVNTLHRKLLLSKVDHFLSHDVPSYLLQSIEAHAAVKIQSIKRGNSARLRLVQSMPALSQRAPVIHVDGYHSLRLDRYKAQPVFHHINTSWPGLQLIHDEPYIFLVNDFITKEECQHLISIMITSSKQKSSVTHAAQTEERTSTTVIADHGELACELAWVRNRIADMTCVALEQLQATKLTRYDSDQFFRKHTDATAAKLKEPWCSRLCNASVSTEELTGAAEPCFLSDRLCTVFVYLNDVPRGGRTQFLDLKGRAGFDDLRAHWLPKLGERLGKEVPSHSTDSVNIMTELSVTPKSGMAVVHFPCTTKEYMCLPDFSANHAGEDAIDPKFILQQFIWSGPPAAKWRTLPPNGGPPAAKPARTAFRGRGPGRAEDPFFPSGSG